MRPQPISRSPLLFPRINSTRSICIGLHLSNPQKPLNGSSYYPSFVFIKKSSSFLITTNQLLQWGSSISEWISSTILRAVPKKKVSHSRKRMRSAHKGLKPDLGISSCPGCGHTKRKHHLCLECYADKVLEWNRGGRRPWDQGVTP